MSHRGGVEEFGAKGWSPYWSGEQPCSRDLESGHESLQTRRKVPMISRFIVAAALLLTATPHSASQLYSSSFRFFPGVYGKSALVWNIAQGPDCNSSWGERANRTSTDTPEQYCSTRAQQALSSTLATLGSSVDTQTQCYSVTSSVTYATCVRQEAYCPWFLSVPPYGSTCTPLGRGVTVTYREPVCTIAVNQSTRANDTVTAAYLVQSINYAVPGARSTITYTDETKRGSTWETKSTASASLVVGFKNELLSFSSSNSLSVTNGTKTALQNSSSWKEKFIFPDDVANHYKDVFTLWINPTLTKYSGCGAPDTVLYGATYVPWVPAGFDPTLPVLQDFSASELLGLTPASTNFKQAFLTQVSQSDILQKVVTLNPFFTSTGEVAVNPVVDKNRFRPVLPDGSCSVSFSGVSSAHPVDCEASYSTSRDTSSTFDTKWALKFGLTILGTVPSEFSVNYVRTEQQSGATSNKAAIHLETSSQNSCVDGQLLVDTMFNTYAVLGNTHTCP